MPLLSYIWLLLCYANFARSNLMEEFARLMSESESGPSTPLRVLPVALGVDERSGCTCRMTAELDVTVCYGFYSCTTFPKITTQSETLKVKSTDIKTISMGDTDTFVNLQCMEIGSNRDLQNIEPLAFRYLSNLKHLSISYNWKLTVLKDDVFVGLHQLSNLTLVSNGFILISHITGALSPIILPALDRLDLSENYFPKIRNQDFIAMKGSNVTELEIVLCQTESIETKSFLPLNNLKSLHLGENNLNSSNIGELLLQLNKTGIDLHFLDISRMGFRKSPPRPLLEIIANTTIKRLIFAQNQFEFLMNDTFPRMVNLELLDLRQVLAIFIEQEAFGPSKFPNLKVLLLSGNNLSGLQLHLSVHLKHLDLSSNEGNIANPGYFAVGPDTFRNMSHLEVLNLSFNRIISIYNFTFQGLEKLRILSLKNGSVFQISPFAFTPMSHLEMLSLENNPFLQNNNVLNNTMFVGLLELRALVLSNCGIRSFDDKFFSVMPNITHLMLRNNKLITLTPETLKPLTKLRVLDLSNNIIVSWLSPLLKPSGAPIRRLVLNNNKITRFTFSMLEDIKYIFSIYNNSADVELRGNVFVCDCSSMYVINSWLPVNGSALLEQFFSESQFTCTSPASWEHKRVFSYLSTYHGINCSTYHSKIRIVVFTVVAIFVILVIASVGALLYVYRFYIRYWLFLVKMALERRQGAMQEKGISNNSQYKYDAFVSYSSDDRDFVVEMIHELEVSSPFFKLCVYERDFEIGSFISESIHSSISDSRYVILVVSDHFAKSQWCRWETQLAEYHRLFLDGNHEYDPLILVRIGEVQPKHLTPTLKYLLKTKIYLKWEGQGSSQDMWKQLRKVLTKK